MDDIEQTVQLPGRPEEKLIDIARETVRGELREVVPYRERIGSRLMGVVLTVICLVSIFFLASWWCTRPALPDARQLVEIVRTDAADKKAVEPQAIADLLVKLQHEHTSDYRDFFQLLVLSGLVPIFTLLAGYVFGRELGRRESESQSGG